MKKFFYLATLVMSVCLFSCNDDDDEKQPSVLSRVESYGDANKIIMDLGYENGKLKTFKVSDFADGQTSTRASYSLTFTDGQLSKLVQTDAENKVSKEKTYTYSGSVVNVIEKEYGLVKQEGSEGEEEVWVHGVNKEIKTKITLNGSEFPTELTSEWEQAGFEGESPIAAKFVITYVYDNNRNLTNSDTKSYVNGEPDVNGNTYTKYKYDSNRSFFNNNNALPNWFIVTDLNAMFGSLNLGVTNNVIEIAAPGFRPGAGESTTNYEYTYNSDRYPTEIYNVFGGEKAENPSYTFHYK